MAQMIGRAGKERSGSMGDIEMWKRKREQIEKSKEAEKEEEIFRRSKKMRDRQEERGGGK